MIHVTFSPESPVGNSQSNSPDTEKTQEVFGPALVHVSRFRARDSEKELPMNVTCGPLFSSSSPSADLQGSLASKLQENLGLSGLPLFDLTWKALDMPAGVPICQLRASARRISDKGFFGEQAHWLMPVLQVSTWTTPNANETGGKPRPSRKNTTEYLGVQAESILPSGWPTPITVDRCHGYTQEQLQKRNKGNLDETVHFSNQDPEKAKMLAKGRGRLNPEFCRWLMGFPEEWSDCFLTEKEREKSKRESGEREKNPWGVVIFLPCSDGKVRPAPPNIFPLTMKTKQRTNFIKGYGNAIVPQVAAVFIKTFMEADR